MIVYQFSSAFLALISSTLLNIFWASTFCELGLSLSDVVSFADDWTTDS